jgi:predicted outer membrane repeat protein
MFDWLQRLFSAATPPRVRRCSRPRVRLTLEQLEDRITPATVWYVDAATDTGAGNLQTNQGDLRFCVNNAAGGDTILFSDNMNGQTINLNNQLVVKQAGLNIVGQDANGQNLTVAISGQNKTRLFEISGGATIDHLTLQNGNGNGGNGGAVLVDKGASLNVDYDQFNSNQVAAGGSNGGAIENDGGLGVSACTFSFNTAAGGNGGAIENTSQLTVTASQDLSQPSTFTNNKAVFGGAIDSFGDGQGRVMVNNSNFDNNQASQSGGAIWTNDSATLNNDTFGEGGTNTAVKNGGAVLATNGVNGANPNQLKVNSCTFASNQATGATASGGAIYTDQISMDVEQSTFTSNTALNANGGAIEADLTNPQGLAVNLNLTLNLDTFKGNQCANEGGAVYSFNVCTQGMYQVIVTNDTFSNNSAKGQAVGLGGGLSIYESTNGNGSNVAASLVNDTFFQNVSTDHGGGLALALRDATGSPMAATAQLTSLTVYLNQATTDSGGMYIDTNLNGVVSVDNSILSGNLVTAQGYNGPVDVTLTNNAALGSEQFNLVGTSDNKLFVSPNDVVTDNPGLANSLAANGAPTGYPQTLALQTSSLGYRTGDQSLAGQMSPFGQDERGFSRVEGSVSIGAEDPDAVNYQ